MSCGRWAVLLSLVTVWMQGCVSAPPAEGSGAFAALKPDSVLTGQTWAYLADQEGSGDSEASQFSSSSGKVPIYVMSSLGPSLEEALSSSIHDGPGIGTGAGDSDITFVDSDSDLGESITEEPTQVDSDIYDLDVEQNQVGEGGDVGTALDDQDVTFGDNEVFGITPTESGTTTMSPEEDNVIPNNVRHSPPVNNNSDSNTISPEHGNEVGGHEGQANDAGDEVNDEGDSDEMSGAPGEGIMAVVMFVGAIGAGTLLSFLLVNLTKIGKKILHRKSEP